MRLARIVLVALIVALSLGCVKKQTTLFENVATAVIWGGIGYVTATLVAR